MSDIYIYVSFKLCWIRSVKFLAKCIYFWIRICACGEYDVQRKTINAILTNKSFAF